MKSRPNLKVSLKLRHSIASVYNAWILIFWQLREWTQLFRAWKKNLGSSMCGYLLQDLFLLFITFIYIYTQLLVNIYVPSCTIGLWCLSYGAWHGNIVQHYQGIMHKIQPCNLLVPFVQLCTIRWVMVLMIAIMMCVYICLIAYFPQNKLQACCSRFWTLVSLQGTKCDVREGNEVADLVAFAQKNLKYLDIWVFMSDLHSSSWYLFYYFQAI